LRPIKTKSINRARIYLKSKELSPGFKKKGKSAAGQIKNSRKISPVGRNDSEPRGIAAKSAH
jgi:hypothetical protein